MRTVWVYISTSRVRVPALSQVGYISVCVSYLREASEDRVSTAEAVETRHDHTGISPAFQIQSTQFFVSIMRLVFVCGCVRVCVCDFFGGCERQRENNHARSVTVQSGRTTQSH